MSGAEIIAVLGVISSIISIVDGTKKVYDAATNAQGLPEAFREVAGRLPIVGNTLDSAKQNIEERKVNNDSCKGVKHIVEACEEKAKKLEELFHKAIPADDASDLKRYYKAVKARGKGSEVESLMKGMLEDVQLLACEHGIKTATKAQQEQITKAIAEVSAVSPSVPELEFQETGFTNKNYGSGTQYNARGENIAQGSARQYISGGGPMSFGQTNLDVTTQSFSLSRPNEDEAQACLRALFLTDICADRAKLISSKGPRVDGTCEWIKSHPLYNAWLRSKSQLLWLSGGPGKGKTMLSIFLAEELEQTARDSQNMLFLQYFCDNKDERRNTAVAVLRGLLFQLLQSRPKMFDHILPSFKIQKESLFLNTSFETLWRIFESMVNDPALETTYCVLDGLDECDETSLEVLLRKFAALFSSKTDRSSVCHLSLLIVSRDLPDLIPELLSSFPRISLDPDADTEINKDIDLFIKEKVHELSKNRQYPEALRVHVENVFRKRAQGTFLWIGIVAQLLRKCKVIEVEKALDLFPRGLDQVYARILLQIDSGRRDIAARILRWVVMAVRPLTLSELSIAIETDVEPSVIASNRDERIRDQVSYCGSFLMIKRDEVGLIHQSAKDYLLRKPSDPNPELEDFRVKEEVANLEIARRCLDYLQSGALENSDLEISRNISGLSRAFPLLGYATFHWHEHARSLARSADIFDLSLPFYHKKSRICMSWLTAYWALESRAFEMWYYDFRPPKSFTLLHLASYFGLLPLAENLVLTTSWIKKMKRSYYLNRFDGSGMTALMWAAERGHEAVVRLLLANGAETKARIEGQGYRTALNMAINNGHESIVQLLVEKGANIEIRDRNGWMALMIATRVNDAMTRLLLEIGANVNAVDENGETALMKAASRFDTKQSEVIVRLLLEKGADSKAQDKHRQTAFMKAAAAGSSNIVELLLEKGPDINAQDKDGETALMKAAKMRDLSSVKLLLEKGSDTNAQNKDGETALMKAAESMIDSSCLELLLGKGADINAQDKDGETALMKAAKVRDLSSVRLLLEKGADINAQNKDGETALMKAAKKRDLSSLRLLLGKGADINAMDKNGETVLMKVAEGVFDSSFLKLLLEKGPDINVQDKDGETALMKAAEMRHLSSVRLLLEKGADINAQNKDGGTALMKAAEMRDLSFMELLLGKGADIKTQDKDGETALMKVVREMETYDAWDRSDYEAIVELLTPHPNP